MMNLIAKVVVWLLKQKRLSAEAKVMVINALITNINALPTADTLTFTHEGTLLIHGKPLTREQAIMIRENAVSLNANAAYALIKDQVRYEAVKMGVHASVSIEMLIFCKAALWVMDQEQGLIKTLSAE